MSIEIYNSDIAIALFVWVVGLVCLHFFAHKARISNSVLLGIYIWHTIFCALYCYNTIIGHGDSVSYYDWSLASHNTVFTGRRGIFGSAFVVKFVRIFSHHLGFGYVSLFALFNILGCWALLIIYKIVLGTRFFGVNRFYLALFIVLLPSYSYWSSAIGKDAIAVLGITLYFWGSIPSMRNVKYMSFGILLVVLVRPHIGFLMVVVSVLSVLALGERKSKVVKGIALALGCVSVLIAPKYLFSYIGIDSNVGVEGVLEFVESRQSLYAGSSSAGVDLTSMHPIERVISYMFRPFIFEARNLFQLITAIENALIMMVFVMALLSCFRIKLAGINSVLNVLGRDGFYFWIGCWFVLGNISSNLGISSRQKWMFVPIMLVYCLAFLAVDKSSKRRKKQPSLKVSRGGARPRQLVRR